MSKEPPVNFYEASLPIYWFFRLFGLAPFSFQGPARNGHLVVTPLDKIIFFLMLSFHCLSIYIFIRQAALIAENQDSGFLSMSWQICFIFVIVSKFFVLIHTFCKQQNLIKFVRTMGSFYKMVSKFHYNSSLKNCFF
jgi:hypothetical protein